VIAPTLVEDVEDHFRHGFDLDDPTVYFADAELVGLPRDVFAAMYVAALARAEHCPVYIERGTLDLYRRYEPSGALWSAWSERVAQVVGALGFAVPVMRGDGPDRGRIAFGSWPPTSAWSGATGRN
jgi:hypothetical protein